MKTKALPGPIPFGNRSFSALNEALKNQSLRSELRIVRESLGRFIGRNLRILAVEQLTDESVTADTFILFSIAGNENNGDFMSARIRFFEDAEALLYLVRSNTPQIEEKKEAV